MLERLRTIPLYTNRLGVAMAVTGMEMPGLPVLRLEWAKWGMEDWVRVPDSCARFSPVRI